MVGLGQRRFVAGLRRRALALPEASPRRWAAALERFAGLLAGKRIVLLGEANHFVHERTAYRAAMIRWLHGHGFRWIAEELSPTDGEHIDRYLQHGDRGALERLVCWGDRSFAAHDRPRPLAGLADYLRHQPTQGLRCEGQALLAELEDLPGLRWFGFDVEYEPGACYAALDSQLWPRADDDAAAERARLEAYLAAGAPQSQRARIEALLDGIAYREAVSASGDLAALAEPMALRERVMLRQLRARLARLGPEDKLIVLAHNLHVARDDTRLRAARGSVGPGGGRVPCVGTALSRERGAELLVVWMLDAGGFDSRPTAAAPQPVTVPPRSLNARLAAVGPRFVVATEGVAALHRRQTIAGLHGHTVRGRVAEQADLLFFTAEVTALAGDAEGCGELAPGAVAGDDG